jgi:CRISPR-associated exonuclease Cas4
MISEQEAIGISFLNALEYCSRRFYYEFVQADMLVNEFVLEGRLLHQHADDPGKTTGPDGETQYRRVYLHSEQLGLSGFADVVEEVGGRLVPVEYKHGKQGHWLNDNVQLCAQALCLEESQAAGSPPIEYGYIFYWGSRRRVQLDFTAELRTKTLALVAEARHLIRLAVPPPPLEGKQIARCKSCSLEPLCLPAEVKLLRTSLKTKGGLDFASFISD